jgi:hypothetical protein
MRLPDAPTRAALVDHLVASGIAGDVATPRQSNLGNVHKMLDRHPEYWCGLDLDRAWTFDEVVTVMVERVGIHADLAHETGDDMIDPELCAAALDAAADRLGRVARERGRVLFATGHPTGLLALYLPLAAVLEQAGCTVVTPGAEQWVDVQGARRRIRYVGGVATIGTGGDLLHTHAPEPMQAILAGADGPLADLVVADHGWAGAAAQHGLPVLGFADTNDPALFVGADEGKLDVVVPLDDNVTPADYAPLAAYLLANRDKAGLSRSE